MQQLQVMGSVLFCSDCCRPVTCDTILLLKPELSFACPSCIRLKHTSVEIALFRACQQRWQLSQTSDENCSCLAPIVPVVGMY